MTSRTKITIGLTDDQAMALVRFIELVTWGNLRETAKDDDEANLMRDALYELRREIGEVGLADTVDGIDKDFENYSGGLPKRWGGDIAPSQFRYFVGYEDPSEIHALAKWLAQTSGRVVETYLKDGLWRFTPEALKLLTSLQPDDDDEEEYRATRG